MQDSAPEVYFRGTIGYGKRYLAFGLGAILLSVLLLALKISNARFARTTFGWNWESLASVSYSAFLIGGSAWWGAYAFYHASKETKWEIVVDSVGCLDETCAKKPFLPWSEIRTIRLWDYHGGYHFVIQPRGPFWRFRILETNSQMTWEQGCTVLQAIKQEVVPKHPHLKFEVNNWPYIT